MEIKQKKADFEPITIILKTHAITDVFFRLIDKLDAAMATDQDIILDNEEADLVIQLSNAITEGKVVV